jgi:hypothetical protein
MILHKRSSHRSLVLAGITILATGIAGCGQKNASSGISSSSPNPVTQTGSAPVPVTPQQKGGESMNHAVLQAQSAYWRAHGQGTNSFPAKKPDKK